MWDSHQQCACVMAPVGPCPRQAFGIVKWLIFFIFNERDLIVILICISPTSANVSCIYVPSVHPRGSVCSNILPIFNEIICLLVTELLERSFHPGFTPLVEYGTCRDCHLSTVALLSEGASGNAGTPLVTLVLGLVLASQALGIGPASSPDASKTALACTPSLPLGPRSPQSPLLLPDFGAVWTWLSPHIPGLLSNVSSSGTYTELPLGDSLSSSGSFLPYNSPHSITSFFSFFTVVNLPPAGS